eukprot:TRINITY_DN3103_c0_g1_i3.p1 TRINITY_DN3103_c0_g1~~TRINITY_DN3103_c0_g1_i3.p1  ORF type:complete len:509 (+),score=-25.05 TRINITY_DN3103_c0_g1_i3:119-1645(+)
MVWSYIYDEYLFIVNSVVLKVYKYNQWLNQIPYSSATTDPIYIGGDGNLISFSNYLYGSINNFYINAKTIYGSLDYNPYQKSIVSIDANTYFEGVQTRTIFSAICANGGLLSGSGNCLSTCTQNDLQKHPSLNQCVYCHRLCKTCNDYTDHGCTSCNPGWTLLNNQCTRCGDGYLTDDEECDDGNIANGDGCSSTCQIQSGYGCQYSPSQCFACHSACTKCTGTSQNECLVCQSGYVLVRGRSCLATCGNGVVEGVEECDDGNNIPNDGCTNCTIDQGYFCYSRGKSACYPKDPLCKVSDTRSSNCFECNDGAYLDTTTKKCREGCSLGSYRKDGGCIKCPSTCLTCQDNSGICTSCSAGLLLTENACLQSCPKGYFVTKDRQGNNLVVRPCPKGCDQCWSETSCLKCSDGYYINPSLDACARCHNTRCQSCVPEAPGTCQSCKFPLIFEIGDCLIPVCPGRQYLDDTSGRCKGCSEGCLVCTGPTQCNTCEAPFYVEYQGECLPCIY